MKKALNQEKLNRFYRVVTQMNTRMKSKITNQCSCQPMGNGGQTSQHSGYTQSSASSE